MTAIDLRKEFDSELLTAVAGQAKSIVCWGSAGSGKSVIAVNLAFELANLGESVCLIDADTYHPSVAAMLGITAPSAGITACLRLARQGRLNLDEFARLSQKVDFAGGTVRVLPGLNSPARWAEVDATSLEILLEFLGDRFSFLVWDIASYLQAGFIDAASGKDRNQAAGFLISKAEVTLASFLADPVGVNRFLFDLREVGTSVWPVANRLRTSVIGRNPAGQIRSILERTAGITLKAELWEDEGFDLLLQSTRPLILQGRNSRTQQELKLLAKEIIKLRGR